MAASAEHQLGIDVDTLTNGRENSLHTPILDSSSTDGDLINQNHPWLQNWLDSVVTRTLCQLVDSTEVKLPTVRKFVTQLGLPSRIACALQYYSTKSSLNKLKGATDSDLTFAVCLDHYLAVLHGDPIQSAEGLLEDDRKNADNIAVYLEKQLANSDIEISLLRSYFADLSSAPNYRLTSEQELGLLVEFYQWICQSSLSRGSLISLQTVAKPNTIEIHCRPTRVPPPVSSTENTVLQNLVKTSGVAVRPARPAHPNSRPLALLNTLAVEQLVTSTTNSADEQPMDQTPDPALSDNLLSTLAQVASKVDGDSASTTPKSDATELGGSPGFYVAKPESINAMECNPTSPRTNDPALERRKLNATFRKRPSPIVSGKLPTIGSPRSSPATAHKAMGKSAEISPRTGPVPSLRSEFEQRKQARSLLSSQPRPGSVQTAAKRDPPPGTTTWAATTKRNPSQDSRLPDSTVEGSVSSTNGNATEKTLPRSAATALRLSLDQRRRAIEVGRRRAAAATEKAVAERHHAAFQKLLQAEQLRRSQKTESADEQSLVSSALSNSDVASKPVEVLESASDVQMTRSQDITEQNTDAEDFSQKSAEELGITESIPAHSLDPRTDGKNDSNKSESISDTIGDDIIQQQQEHETSTVNASPPSSTVPDQCPEDAAPSVEADHLSSSSEHSYLNCTESCPGDHSKTLSRVRQSTPQPCADNSHSCCCHHTQHLGVHHSRTNSFRCRHAHHPMTHSPLLSRSPHRHTPHIHPRELTACSLNSEQFHQLRSHRSSGRRPGSSRRNQPLYLSYCPCQGDAYDPCLVNEPHCCEYHDPVRYEDEEDVELDDRSFASGSYMHLRSSCTHEPSEAEECIDPRLVSHFRSQSPMYHVTLPRQRRIHTHREASPHVLTDQLDPGQVDQAIRASNHSIDCASLPTGNRIPAYLRNSSASLSGRATWSERPKLRDLSVTEFHNRSPESRDSPQSEQDDAIHNTATNECSRRLSPEESLFDHLNMKPATLESSSQQSPAPVESSRDTPKPEPKQFFIAFGEADPQRMQRKCDQLEARRAAERALMAQQQQARRDREREEKQNMEMLERERRLREWKRREAAREQKEQSENHTPRQPNPYPVRSGATVLSRSEASLPTMSKSRRAASQTSNRKTPPSQQRFADVRSSIQRPRTKSANKLAQSVVGLRGSGDGEATRDSSTEENGSPVRTGTRRGSNNLTNGKSIGLSLSSLHRLGVNETSSTLPSSTQPKLFVKPKAKSNRMVIVNAIGHACLAGAVNEPMKQATLKELASNEGTHFMILFRDSRCQYRAVYSFDLELEELRLICGTGPRRITHDMANRFYKYNSGAKQFTEITSTSHLSPVVDAITIHDSLWNKSNNQSAAALSLVSGRI